MSTRYRELVRKHKDWIFTFAFYALGNKEEAEDVTQEVLMRLWSNLDDLRPGTITAWTRRVTTNACIDTARRRRAYRARIVASGEVEEFSQAVSRELDPALWAENEEIREHIRLALAQLNEPYRSIVIQREIQDMKYEEISEALQLPLNTVKSYLHRGRRMLREHLGEFFDE